MSQKSTWKPAPMQVVSDLGQLTAFGHPDQSRILRILQREEATAGELGTRLDMPEGDVVGHLQRLSELVLVRRMNSSGERGSGKDVYRATARMFNLKPTPRDQEAISVSIGATMLEALSGEILSSLQAWPDQKLNYEGRRTRLPLSRVVEFNDRLVELLREYWGDDVEPVDEDPEDPLMSFLGVWYRLVE